LERGLRAARPGIDEHRLRAIDHEGVRRQHPEAGDRQVAGEHGDAVTDGVGLAGDRPLDRVAGVGGGER
jgi:hypothetical protein